MTVRPTLVLFTAALAAGSLAAQQPGINARLAASQPPKYTPPLCPIKAMNSKVDKASQLLRKAYDAKTPADKAANLAEARSNITAAIAQEAQGSNPAAWYFLARIALMRGDAAEADSGFTKAQALAPTCEIDITQYRQNSWANLGQAGIEFQKQGQMDSALAQFRDASTVFRGLPHVFSNMGVVFANADRDDSAAVYFGKALEVAEADTSLVEDRNAAAMNLAIMHQRTKNYPAAIQVLRKYLGWRPDDMDARKSLSAVFRDAGMTDSADALDNAMVAEFSKSNLDSLDTADLMAVGVAAFNGKKYQEAEDAFARAVKRNPYSRDARYNLASTYLALKDWAKLEEHSTRLVEQEPMYEDALRLLGQAQRGLGKDEEVIKTATKLVSLPFTIEVTGFQLGKSAARLLGGAVGRTPEDAAGKPIKTGPVTVVIEFLDTAGAVVDTKEFTVPVLSKGQTHALQVDAKGAGIAGWKYHVK